MDYKVHEDQDHVWVYFSFPACHLKQCSAQRNEQIHKYTKKPSFTDEENDSLRV